MNFQQVKHRTISGELGNGGAEAERVRLRFEREDTARMEYLDGCAHKTPSPNQHPRVPAPTCLDCGKRLRKQEDGTYRERCRDCRHRRGEWTRPSRAKAGRA